MTKYKPFRCEGGLTPHICFDFDGNPYAVLMRPQWVGGTTQEVAVEVIKLEVAPDKERPD